jgi:hypothetical protein
MTRNVLWFLAGFVVAVGAVYVAVHVHVQTSRGRMTLFDVFVAHFVSSPGSPIRVVGGSIKIEIPNGPDLWASASQVVATNADAWAYQVVNVSKDPMGVPETRTYTQNQMETWTIKELVNDSAGGIEITGTTGNNPASGTITFEPINNVDSISPVSPAASGEQWWKYQNHLCPPGSPSENCVSDKVKTIEVQTKGTPMPDVWYCRDPMFYCHVYIGSALRQPR